MPGAFPSSSFYTIELTIANNAASKASATLNNIQMITITFTNPNNVIFFFSRVFLSALALS